MYRHSNPAKVRRWRPHPVSISLTLDLSDKRGGQRAVSRLVYAGHSISRSGGKTERKKKYASDIFKWTIKSTRLSHRSHKTGFYPKADTNKTLDDDEFVSSNTRTNQHVCPGSTKDPCGAPNHTNHRLARRILVWEGCSRCSRRNRQWWYYGPCRYYGSWEYAGLAGSQHRPQAMLVLQTSRF